MTKHEPFDLGTVTEQDFFRRAAINKQISELILLQEKKKEELIWNQIKRIIWFTGEFKADDWVLVEETPFLNNLRNPEIIIKLKLKPRRIIGFKRWRF